MPVYQRIPTKRLLAAFVWFPLLFLFALPTPLSAEDSEAARFQAAWPSDNAPFSDWTLLQAGQTEGEIRFQIQHKETSERARLVLRRKASAKPSYKKTKCYDLFYESERKQAHTSPELARLLPEWAQFIEAHEPAETSLMDYERAKRRMEKRQKERLDAEQQKRAEAKAKAKRLSDFFGFGLEKDALSEKLSLFFFSLFFFLLLFLLPRIMDFPHIFANPDVHWLRTKGLGEPFIRLFVPVMILKFYWLTPPQVIAFAKAISRENLFTFGNTVTLPAIALLGFVERILGMDTLIFTLLQSALLLAAATLCMLSTYLLTFNRYAALACLILYIILRLVFSDDVLQSGGLLFDIALFTFPITLFHQAFDKKNSWRIFLAIPVGLLALYSDPRLLPALLVFYFGYLYFETNERVRVFSFFGVWLVSLGLPLFTMPLYLMAAFVSEANTPTQSAFSFAFFLYFLGLIGGIVAITKEHQANRHVLAVTTTALGIYMLTSFLLPFPNPSPIFTPNAFAWPVALIGTAIGAFWRNRIKRQKRGSSATN